MFSDYRAFGFCKKQIMQGTDQLNLLVPTGSNKPQDSQTPTSVRETALIYFVQDTELANLTFSFDVAGPAAAYDLTFPKGSQIAGVTAAALISGQCIAYIFES